MSGTETELEAPSYSNWSSEDLAKLDFRKFAKPEEDFYLRPVLARAEAAASKYTPITVEQRFQGFKLLGFHPHGYWLPDEQPWRRVVYDEVRRLGKIGDVTDRLRRYHKFQELTGRLAHSEKVKGHWTGQLEVARSEAQFRLVACGRRWGKTFYIVYEALGVCLVRPQTRVWIAAPIMRLVHRSFSEYLVPLISELGVKTKALRDGPQEKYVVFENGSTIEGISLDNVLSIAGATIDLAIVDEAAQMLPDAWYRGIMPPLASHNGQALLISSYEGEGDFFSDQVAKVEAEEAEYRSRITDMVEVAPKIEWQQFNSPSYDANFYDFPQGQETPSIQLQRRNMPPEEFAEQFGARAMGARERVYKEFSDKIHVGDYWFDPDQGPVYLSIDPSAGINEYAIAAFQHWKIDGVECVVQIDEFYRVGMTAETIAPIIDVKPWRPYVEEAVVDIFAGEDEVIRWLSLGYPAIGTPDPGEVEVGIPIVRNFLRHPIRYYYWWRSKVNEVLADMGLPPDEDEKMLTKDTHEIMTRVAGMTGPQDWSAEDIAYLRGCSRLFIASHCVNSIKEYKMYSHEKKRKQNVNYKERPRKFKDHIMDATRNHFWTHYRHELDGVPRLPRSYLGLSGSAGGPYTPEDFGQYLDKPRPLKKLRSPGQGWLGEMRDLYTGAYEVRGHSYMGTGAAVSRQEALRRAIAAPVEEAV